MSSHQNLLVAAYVFIALAISFYYMPKNDEDPDGGTTFLVLVCSILWLPLLPVFLAYQLAKKLRN